MPRHCSAGGCKSRDNRETRNAGITFHKLPKGETRRNLWITNSHRADYWDPQTDFVYFCSKHFTPESFELTGCSGIRRLKEDAFPTVFESVSKAKSKRQETVQKQEDNPVRKDLHSGVQQTLGCLNTQQTEKGEPAEERTGLRSVVEAEETNKNTPASSQEPSREAQLSHQECSPSSPPVSRPVSPSRYMRRLPPPPGFYLSKEHSYAQLCPLLWRRRYDQAIDCLEKALRQLHAARRRENRLRSTVLRLRDKRLKQAMLVSRDGCKNRECLTPGGGKRRGKVGCNHEESETDAKSEDARVFEDRCVDQMEFGGHFLPDTSSWSKDEKGDCFYCGRRQGQGGAQVTSRVLKTGKDTQPTVHEDSLKIQRSIEISTDIAESSKDMQVILLERPPAESAKTSDSGVRNSGVLNQIQSLHHVIPAEMSLTENPEQSLPFVGSQQKSSLSDMCEGETEVPGQERHLDLQQQLFWVQDNADGQVILVPVHAEDRLQTILKMQGVADEAQTILVSKVDLTGDMGHMTENSVGLSRVQPACDGEHSEQHSVSSTTAVEMREDVREKLKEHLEGFHLQLSTEFLN